MADVIQAGQALLAGILATLPVELQGKAKEVFDSAEAAAAVKVLGEGALRQEDYSRNLNTTKDAEKKANDLFTANQTWWQSAQAEIAELEALKAKVATLEGKSLDKPIDKPVVDPTMVSRTDLEKILADTERGAVGFIAESNLLSLQHYKEFGEILNITELLQDKRVQQIGLSGVYRDKFKEQIAAKATAAQTARDDQIRKEERAKVQQEMSLAQSPYPIRGNEPSTLDALEAARAGKAPALKSVDDMAAEYARLASVRTSV